MAENLVSNWSDGKRLPENYVFPPKLRPGEHNIPISNSIPIIDFAKVNGPDRAQIIQNIIEAGLEFGFFQVINHGVPLRVLDDTRSAIKDFFELPLEEKSKHYSYDMSRNCIVFTSSLDYEREEIHNWRDSLRLVCNPLEECIQSWPEKPSIFRDFMGEYVTKVSELGSRIMELIAKGLGLEPEYFTNEICREQSMFVHHYPPCPDPSLTLGTRKHGDTGLITILLQDNVPGLQVLKDDQWVGIQPIPNAFVVNFGYQLQIVSNGKVRSAEHRVVTSKKDDRYTAAMFFQPAPDFVIQPAKSLVNAENSSLYKGVRYADFMQTFRKAYSGTIKNVMEPFMLRK